MLESCNGLIERLYATALAGSEWPETIRILVEALEADHAFLSHADPAWNDGLFVAGTGLDDENLARFVAYAPRPYLSFQDVSKLYAPGKVVSSADILSDSEVERSAFYNEVIRLAGGFYSLTSVGGQGSSFNLAICRNRRAGAFDAAARRTVETLAPHIATALELHHRLSIAQRSEAGTQALLERVSDAVILWAGSGVQFVNQNARRILGEADGLSLGDNGHLSAGDAATTRRLHDTLAAAMIADDGHVRRIALRRPSGRLPLIASILPLGRAGVPGTSGCIGLFVCEPGAPHIDLAVLRELFGLTAREADVAARLAAGHSPAEVAEILRLGIGTVRSHLKQIYAKTAVNSQAGLMSVLHGCASGPR